MLNQCGKLASDRFLILVYHSALTNKMSKHKEQPKATKANVIIDATLDKMLVY